MADSDWMNYARLRGAALPARIEFRSTAYKLEKEFKNDFYAATGLYSRVANQSGDDCPNQIIFKVYHTDRFGPFPMRWLGRRLCNREVSFLESTGHIAGLARCLGRVGDAGYIREYIPGTHLRDFRREHQPEAEFYQALEALLAEIHECGIAHNDLSKPENILVTPDGKPCIIDFQIAARFAYRWPMFKQVGRCVRRYLQSLDRYHLRKHHRRGRRQDFAPSEIANARRKGILLWLHGCIIRRPYRVVRHFLMNRFLRVTK